MIPRLMLTLAVAFAAVGAAPAQGADIKVSVDGAALPFDQSTPQDISERMALPAAPNSTATTYQGWSLRRLAGARADDIDVIQIADMNRRLAPRAGFLERDLKEPRVRLLHALLE